MRTWRQVSQRLCIIVELVGGAVDRELSIGSSEAREGRDPAISYPPLRPPVTA